LKIILFKKKKTKYKKFCVYFYQNKKKSRLDLPIESNKYENKEELILIIFELEIYFFYYSFVIFFNLIIKVNFLVLNWTSIMY
jgi:hypothetical protein